MDFVIAVRTYKRYDLFKRLTYKVLLENKLTDRLYIFVADEEEKELYVKSLEGMDYKEIVVGKKGGAEATRAIHKYFPLNQRLICMDDDLKSFYHFTENKKLVNRSTLLKRYIEDAFETLDRENYKAFGFNCSTNGLYIRNKSWKEYGIKFLGGWFFGCRNTEDIATEEIVASGSFDDLVRTVNFIDTGGILYYNMCGFTLSDMGTLEGGFQSSGERSKLEERKESQRIKIETLFAENKLMNLYYSSYFWDEKKQLYNVKLKRSPEIKKFLKARGHPDLWKKYDWEEWAKN